MGHAGRLMPRPERLAVKGAVGGRSRTLYRETGGGSGPYGQHARAAESRSEAERSKMVPKAPSNPQRAPLPFGRHPPARPSVTLVSLSTTRLSRYRTVESHGPITLVGNQFRAGARG